MADENQANVTYLNPPSLERSPGYRQEMRARPTIAGGALRCITLQ